MSLSVRVQFGKYGLVERLASGGMGETWLAELIAAEGVTKEVVLKKMLPELAQSPERVRSFIEEARLSATLSHGNIAQVFDFGQVDGEYYLALEYVHGQSLERVLARARKQGQARLPFAIGVYLVIELLEALHYAHTRVDQTGQPLNLVHRDVTPDNVLISYDGEVKLVDFGVAKTSELGRSVTHPGLVKGKYRYHSPEQALARKLDRRSDVFGAGIILFELLSGGPMFVGQGHVVMQQVAYGEIPNLRVRAPDVPEALVAITMKAVSHNPDDRFASAQQMQEQLSRWLAVGAPGFSSELLRELMNQLFDKELNDEGKRPERNERMTDQLRELWESAKTNPVPPPAMLVAPPLAEPPPAQSGRRMPVVAIAAVAIAALAAGGFVLSRRDTPSCARAGEVALAAADEPAARAAVEKCLGGRVPESTELAALALIERCATQRARLKDAELELSAGRPERAETALGFAPASCVLGAHQQLLDRLRAAKPQPKAVADAKPMAVVDESPATALYERAKALHKQGGRKQYELEKPLLEQCVKADPRHAECYMLLGAVYAGLGDAPAGAAAYERFLELAPDHAKAKAVRHLLDTYRHPPTE